MLRIVAAEDKWLDKKVVYEAELELRTNEKLTEKIAEKEATAREAAIEVSKFVINKIIRKIDPMKSDRKIIDAFEILALAVVA